MGCSCVALVFPVWPGGDVVERDGFSSDILPSDHAGSCSCKAGDEVVAERGAVAGRGRVGTGNVADIAGAGNVVDVDSVVDVSVVNVVGAGSVVDVDSVVDVSVVNVAGAAEGEASFQW